MKTGASTFALDLVKSLRAHVVPEVREMGDVGRNAAVFLARKAGDRRSSFERNLRPSLDTTRLSEVPYLASIGYLFAAGALTHVPLGPLRVALERAVRRASHTAERTGYADDAMCASGLLLLAQVVNDESTARSLRDGLSEVAVAGAALGAVVAVATGSPVRLSFELDPASTEQLAAALLLHRIDEVLARRLFPGFPSDLEGHLLGLLAKEPYSPAADFAAMTVLVAIEASVTVPDDELPAVDGSCDVGIVIALKEEFRLVFDRFEARHTHVEDGGRSYYVFDVVTLAGDRPYRCVATLVGEMGTNRTGVIAQKMLERWDPAVVVVLGIAGGIHSDVRLGDVIVASEVSNYVEGAKAVDGASGVSFQRGSDSFKTGYAVLERVRNFEFANRASFLKWEATCAARCSSLGTEVEPLRKAGHLGFKPSQKEGHLASGPLVVTSHNFVTWVRDGDRACLGIEMEAGGLMIAAHMNPTQRDALVVRGVSDFADDRKAALDQIGDGRLRRYAMENATDFLWSLMEAGVLPRGPDALGPPQPKKDTLEQALLRELRERADENGEVTATWETIHGWLDGAPGDPHAAAINLKEEGYFRTQTFEGGPDGICSVVLRR